MQTISKAVKRSGALGEPLPGVYKSFEGERKIHFRKGATSMIAGPPGSFKSTFALNLCTDWAQRGQSGLYVSADSDQFTVGKRCAGILTGDPTWRIEKTLRSGGYSEALALIRDIHWEFRSLDIEQIDLRVKAHHVMYGSFPDFIVIDNLMNMVENPDDWGGMLRMIRDLDELSRGTGSHVMVLHHTHEEPPRKGESGSWETAPQGIWSIMGKVNQFPRLILTLMASGPLLMVAPVKNTNGPSDRTGKDYVEFEIHTDSCQVMEIGAP